MHLTYLLVCCFNFRFLLNMLCKQQPIYLNKCCKLKQRFLRVWHRIDQTASLTNGMDVFAHVGGQKADFDQQYSATWQETFQFLSNVSRFLACFFWKLPQFHTSNFRKVVRQHTEGMVGSATWVFFEIYLAFQQWKNFENPLRIDKVIAMSSVCSFFGPPCMVSLVTNQWLELRQCCWIFTKQ